MLKMPVPFVDLRGKTPVDLLRAYPDKAQALITASRRTWGIASYAASALALPFADKRSCAWLKRTSNPYLHEIESFADILRSRGVYSLNLCYEWGCTSGAYRNGDSVSLLRVLDWPFPALGRHVMVVHQQGKAGSFYNITWPAVAGVFSAMAPGRFSATLNMAPMRSHGLSYPGDWLKNRMLIQQENGLPASHLLRQVFEQATDYESAKAMLSKTPIASPVIYILAGMRPGEGCVIERLEDDVEVTELAAGKNVCAANHFTGRFASISHGWRPRMVDSYGRLEQSGSLHGHDLQDAHFNWMRSPMLSEFTRMAAVMDAATQRLTVQGFEGPAQVTESFSLPTVSYARQEAV